jgi:DNA polymerase I-like protein with 3'-5' exonuclease and polymerase domains
MVQLPPDLSWLALEHRVAEILSAQEVYGWRFDVKRAQDLDSQLSQELRLAQEEAIDKFPLVPDVEFTPKRSNKAKGYHAGCVFQKLKDFNPTSRDQIAWILQREGWKPKARTEKGKVQIDETVLKEVGTPTALSFLRMLDLTKQIGMVSQGDNAWLKLVTLQGRLHHHCSVKAVTHRCAHSGPNLGQVPSDLRFRELFIPDDGHLMVGADLSGIELRMLAHYLARYDDGKYADILLNGDIHQVNADKIGISRKAVKTVTYAFIYGAGDEKIGLSYDPSLKPAAAKRRGAEIRQAFLDAIDGLEELVDGVKAAVRDRGRILSIDKRPIKVTSPHAALNYLLQSGAGVIAKRWMVMADHATFTALLGESAHQLAFIHDELQFTCHPNMTQLQSDILTSSAKEAGEFYNLRLPIAAEAKVGKNWAEVH